VELASKYLVVLPKQEQMCADSVLLFFYFSRLNYLQVAIIYTSNNYDASAIASSITSENGIRCISYRSNVTDAQGIEKTVQQIERDFGHLDIVVANAGVASYSPAEDYTPAQFSEVMSVNLDGAFYTAQAAARIFKKQGKGNLIFTASVSAILVNIPQKQAAVSSQLSSIKME
jgi:sorbose reductase